jgi:hypothetical protein
MLITVFGRRGSGKTTLIRHMVPQQVKPVLVVDILGNYIDDSYPHVTAYSAQEALNEIRSYMQNPKKHPGIIVVADSDISRSVDFCSSALWHTFGGTLILDEVDAINVSESPCFDEAIRYGRNRGIHVITGCRRPAELSRNITAGADLALCLTTQEPRDIEYYRDFLGDDLAFTLPKLPQYHGVYKDFKTGKSGLFKTDPDGKIHVLRVFSQGKPELPATNPQEKRKKSARKVQETREIPEENQELDDNDCEETDTV